MGNGADLINECKDIVLQHMKDKQGEAVEYNIYRLLNVTNKEVPMCRILADFLDPAGSHGEGAKYLKAFFKVVLDKENSENDLMEARVYREEPITDNRRIDIAICYRDRFIPIEVKINAADQKSQCYDYCQFARRWNKEAYIVYLTKTGHAPSDYSLTGKSGDKLDGKDIVKVSFKEDIVAWLKEIKKTARPEMVPFIDQYMKAVKDFAGSKNEEYTMELKAKIIESEDSLRTAIELEKTMNSAKADLMKKVFEEFRKQMEPILETYGLEEESRSGWHRYEEWATEEFYAQRASTFPGLNYVVKSVDLGENLSLWLRIEIDNRLYVGLCVFDYGASSDTENETGNKCTEISDDLWNRLCNNIIKLPGDKKSSGWFFAWEYLPTGSDCTRDAIAGVPDFKQMNDAAVALADDKHREEFVKESINKIKDMLRAQIKVSGQ